MPMRLNAHDAAFEAAFAKMLVSKREDSIDVNQTVAAILADVRARGDAAVLEYTERFDRIALNAESMAIGKDQLARAADGIDRETLDALVLAADRINAFHAKQVPDDLDYVDDSGVRLGYRWTPVHAAGLYVPGGTAAYPSSVLMNAIPAKVAGVGRLVMVVPTPDGVVNPLVLAAAHLAGVDEVYRIGGAQAIGALAYGTRSIAPVDKIVGPGNAFVAAAKKQVFGTVGIDMIAGPSEILVIADGDNDPDWIAADLLSQAEHDTAAQSILLTDDTAFADAVARAVEKRLETLPRADIARQSWCDFGVIITVDDLFAAGPIIDRIAAEHVELALADPDAMAGTFTNAGAIFMGRYTPEAIGDYVGGPNHVLPTARSARFSSGLGVLDFLKRSSIIACDAAGLNKIGPSAVRLAKAEGLDAHGLSVALRLNMPRT
ncbi:histidinol dehydrogenase [Varunaivibrio sulfuroxidans]|uniref:Histidinol dehydrogenase n=1 Tax=Varunaivibrio sulfuroxidans TaxID=1773489 RepID=A0A4R3J5Q8_9PROT|nr:histidinol dehydrogenase [Varunaivibrio sulfuroxidans]TCS60156.1 histidinol dehydrogenase [Varunaivibrio sulfuroxidans]WES30873.1 histidinol dehydrogenase [Varunaivibrio sulfuroxidans]